MYAFQSCFDMEYYIVFQLKVILLSIDNFQNDRVRVKNTLLDLWL